MLYEMEKCEDCHRIWNREELSYQFEEDMEPYGDRLVARRTATAECPECFSRNLGAVSMCDNCMGDECMESMDHCPRCIAYCYADDYEPDVVAEAQAMMAASEVAA